MPRKTKDKKTETQAETKRSVELTDAEMEKVQAGVNVSPDGIGEVLRHKERNSNSS